MTHRPGGTSAQGTTGRVVSVHAGTEHAFAKPTRPSIRLLDGVGVEGDAHAGTTVQHRSRVARTPHLPNLRQVHLIEAELFDELTAVGHSVGPGELGENITTTGLDLLALPTGTVLTFGLTFGLTIGAHAQVRLTGLRNPCRQIDDFQAGLRRAVRITDGPGFRRGAMAVVTRSGEVRAGDRICVRLPTQPYAALARV